MSVEIINGDIFWTNADYIAHQCNCVSTGGAAGIARAIFEKYPYADCYTDRDRTNISMPGTIDVRGSKDKVLYRGIINMFSQYFPGGLPPEDNTSDNELLRRKWFHECLMEISKLEFKSIAFPDHIGCSIAGGDWNWYLDQLNKFADYVEKTKNARVLVYKLPNS